MLLASPIRSPRTVPRAGPAAAPGSHGSMPRGLSSPAVLAAEPDQPGGQLGYRHESVNAQRNLALAWRPSLAVPLPLRRAAMSEFWP